MPSEDLKERVTRLEEGFKTNSEKLHDHDRKLEAQAEKNDTLTRFVTLFESHEKANEERERRQEERDRKHQEQLEKFGDAMEEAVISLSNLNKNQQLLGDRVSDIETTLQDQKTTADSRKLDPVDIMWKSVIFILTITITAVITNYFTHS